MYRKESILNELQIGAKFYLHQNSLKYRVVCHLSGYNNFDPPVVAVYAPDANIVHLLNQNAKVWVEVK